MADTELTSGQRLVEAIREIRSMPYTSNDNSGHEKALEAIFIKHGFKTYVFPKENKKKPGKKKDEALKWIENPELAPFIPDNSIIHQPFGSQDSPDFIVKANNKFIFIEAKSSKEAYPTYNSGGVNRKFLYIFCSKKGQETTLFRGCDIITSEQNRLIREHIEEARVRDEAFNARMRELDTTRRGFGYYTRPMIDQKGGGSLTNYFTHESRRETETLAFDWLKSECGITE